MHEGHRERMRKRFVSQGLNSFEQHEILELLLYYCIPRKDTNAIAHLLIQKFGSIEKVLEANIEELRSVSDMSFNAAVLLAMVPQLFRIYSTYKNIEKLTLTSSKDVGEYMVSLFTGYTDENFFILCLDSRNRVNYLEHVHRGVVNEAVVYPRKLVEIAIRHRAVGVILAHNHPAGTPEPSRADIKTTRCIETAMGAISINVVDHIIVTGTQYVSFAEKGLLGKV